MACHPRSIARARPPREIALTVPVDAADTVDAVTVRAPAKVNLLLAVGDRRPDGYHELTTVYQAVSLTDEVTATAAPGEVTATVSGEGAGDVPPGEDNLAVRAARLLAAEARIDAAVRLVIRKGIPVAGGMAGGSADAAAALVACSELWGLGLDREVLARLGAQLGSDVPFALHGGTALGTGRGGQLTDVLARGDYHWVFALADGGLPTPGVYAELDRLRSTPEDASVGYDAAQPVLAALRAGDPAALGQVLRNDLEPPALRLRPGLRRTLDAGRELGALGARVSGSGPTCAFLARDETDAIRLAAALAGTGVCRTVRRAHAPTTGARVVG